MVELLVAEEPVAQRSDDEVGQFIEWCTRNKVGLLSLPDDLPFWLTTHPTFATAIDAERAWYDTQRSEYLTIRERWLARGIECLMIKPAGNAPSFPHLSDNIDILVRPEDGAAARDTLRELGYVEIRNVEEPQKFLFRRFHAGRCVSAIHVHERIAWFVGFLDDDLVWQRARSATDDPAVLIPSPEDAILINLAHACYENKELRLVEVLRVRHALAAADQIDWGYLDEIAERRGWLDGLAFMLLVLAEAEAALFGASRIPAAQIARYETILRDDEPAWQRLANIRAMGVNDLPLDLSYRFCKRLYYRKIASDPERDRSGKVRDVAATLIWGVKLKSGLRPQLGMVVSLSGVDGSGKTTHAEHLVAAARLCELRAKYVWGRGGSGGIVGTISRFRRTDNAATTSDPIERRKSRLRRPAVRLAWAWLVAGEQIGRTFWRAWLPARRGRIVVTDRAAVDTVVEMDASLPDDARWSRLAIAAMLRLSPSPDLGYVLDLSPETARARKSDEVWHSGWEDERRRYLELAPQLDLRVLSTEGTFAQSNDRIIREVLMAFMAGYETRLNGLLYSNPSQKNRPDAVWAKGATQ